jgi:S4 domain protein YaaA
MSNNIDILIKTPYITLGQFLKYIGIISFGGEAKSFLSKNEIFVNEQIESRRGKKLKPTDNIKINDKIYIIKCE